MNIKYSFMKTIFYTSLLFSLVLFSCEKTPEASFSTNTETPVVGQEVLFNNESHNAERFEWDFGDGFISTEIHPGHVFNATGTYEVSLTAISKSGVEDNATMMIDVLIPTLLEIEVREYYDEYVVPDASVILYPTSTDWDDQTNKLMEGFTDKSGIVVFANLDPFVYYVDVWETEHDNYALRAEDIGFIRTPEVLPNTINRFVAWVDYVNHGKGTARSTDSFAVRKITRVASEKGKTDVPDTTGWRELYARSIIKK
jgi:PKD repeat protein